MTARDTVRSGVGSTAQLLQRGWTHHTIAAAVAAGTLTRLRPGWFARAAIDDVETAFRCLLRCGTVEDVIVVADSLLHLRLATLQELERWIEGSPLRIRGAIAGVDAAESGLETMVRLRVRARNVRVRTQVVIGDARVDLLVTSGRRDVHVSAPASRRRVCRVAHVHISPGLSTPARTAAAPSRPRRPAREPSGWAGAGRAGRRGRRARRRRRRRRWPAPARRSR